MSSGEDVSVEDLNHAARDGGPRDESEMEEIEEDRDAILEWSEIIDSGEDDDEMDRIGGIIAGMPL